MRLLSTPVALLLVLFLCSGSMAAQDEDYFKGIRVGLTMGVSGFSDFYNDYRDLVEPYSEYWLGCVVNMEDYLMVRTLLAFNFTNLNRTNNLPGGGDHDEPFWRLGGTVGLFYHFGVKRNLYCYTGPELSYIYTSYEDDNSFTSSDYEENTANEVRLSGIFGCRYMVTPSFGIFTDLGMGFLYMDIKVEDFGTSPGEEYSKYRSVYIYHAQVGVVFYIN